MRVASVAPALRQLAVRAAPLSLAVTLAEDAIELPGLAALLKLAQLEAIPTTVSAGGESAARLARGDRRVSIERPALASELPELLVEALGDLLSGRELARLGLGAATELARHVALRIVAGRVLEAESDEQAAAALLGGLTSGEGLGFHRAALFVPDRSGALALRKAVGPADREDAHRIWEAIEEAGVALDEQLGPPSRPSPLETRVLGLRLAAREAPVEGDEVAAALAGEAHVFRRPDGPVAPELAALAPAREFVLCRFSARGRVHGLLFADRAFGPPEIEPDRLDALVSFASHAALAWETRRLLRDNAFLARRDPLTGLLNRRALEEALDDARAEARERGRPFGLLLMDLDHFRDVNNTRGHEAGDALLRAAGELLREELGGEGHAARFGGDELAAVVPGAGPLEVAALAERVGRAAMAQGISLSVGAAAVPGDCASADDAVATADARLYAAKRAGRGCAVVPGRDAPLPFADDPAAPPPAPPGPRSPVAPR